MPNLSNALSHPGFQLSPAARAQAGPDRNHNSAGVRSFTVSNKAARAGCDSILVSANPHGGWVDRLGNVAAFSSLCRRVAPSARGKNADRSVVVRFPSAQRPAGGRLRSRPARAHAGRLLSEPGLAGRHHRHAGPNGAVRPPDNWRTSVVDLSHGMFEQFFKVIAEIGFEQEARRRLIQPVVLFITDSAPVTAQSYAELRRRLELTTSCRCTTKRSRSCLSRQIFRRRRRTATLSAFRALRRSCAASSTSLAFRSAPI